MWIDCAMNRLTYCVYNETRECFLSLNVAVADNTVSRLRGLIGKLRLRVDEGVWIVPSQGASVLELPTHTIYSSQTQPGDQLLICNAEEMEHRFIKKRAEVPDTQMEPVVREAWVG